jgi:purine-binding chemotaxis protein CheW
MNELSQVSGRETADMLATFRLNGVAYGLNSRLLQEVIRLNQFTPVHRTAPYVVGIINLRGKIVTVIDLAARLGIGKVESPDRHPILIIPYQQEQIGLLVDEIDDVVPIEPDQLQPVPSNVDRSLAANFESVVRVKDNLVTILNPGPILQEEGESYPSA